MSAYEWARLVVDVVFRTASLIVSLVMIVVFWKMYRFFLKSMNPVLSRSTPSTGRLMLRAIFCRHRGAVCRVKDPYGRHYTACAGCGTDVNEGKPREEWR